jgi:hypothetical protein
LAYESRVVAAFFDEGLSVPKSRLNAARYFFRKPLRIRSICDYENPTKKILNILAADPVQFVLGRHDIAIEDGDGDNVRKTVMIGLLLSGYGVPLVALFTAADDIECDIEGLNIDTFHIGRAKP